MFDQCPPILINNLYGLLTINTTNNILSCNKTRQWYFFYDYGYTLLIRFINIAHLISNSYILKIYSNKNNQQTFLYDSTNSTIINNNIQFDIKIENSGIWVELISNKQQTIPQISFLIDYVFRTTTSQSRYGRDILQDNSSLNSSQPAFIALITIIAILVFAIIIAITILCYRYFSHRQHSRRRHKTRSIPIDHAHLAESTTPSSTSTYSNRSTHQLFSNRPMEIPQQISSLGQSINTLPSMVPSRRLQQSMMDAYLHDLNSFQPSTINNSKPLNSYLFIDLHSTSSETIPDVNSRKYSIDNTTTSGYDTSTGGEERNRKISLRYRRRRARSYHHQQRQRQRNRSNLPLKRSNAPRFLMRERSLPNTLLQLPQLRQKSNHILNIRDSHSTSTMSNNNQDFISTNLSFTTDDYDDSQDYHNNQSCNMDTIEEETTSSSTTTTDHQQKYLFEMVSIHRGDDSDMPNYERLPIPRPNSHTIGDGIAYVNDSIIV